jgi:chemotaxis protein MotB
MKYLRVLFLLLIVSFLMPSCVSKKRFVSLEQQLEDQINEARAYKSRVQDCNKKLAEKDQAIALVKAEQIRLEGAVSNEQSMIRNLNGQIDDLKKQRESQLSQVEDLTVLSKSANENIGNTIKQLENKDRYIQLLNMAKSKADSMNLALAINLKGVLAKGIEDEDIEVKVDKTVVFINLSDKMLYQSGSANISDRASEVLAKIAQIIKSRPEVDVMVEGYTDSNPISNDCMQDNWDLSVKRATSVVRVLQNQYEVDPNKLIAAGRGQYNAIADNSSAEGRSTNRRTRIIIMPKLNQFYDLLDPEMAAK